MRVSASVKKILSCERRKGCFKIRKKRHFNIIRFLVITLSALIPHFVCLQRKLWIFQSFTHILSFFVNRRTSGEEIWSLKYYHQQQQQRLSNVRWFKPFRKKMWEEKEVDSGTHGWHLTFGCNTTSRIISCIVNSVENGVLQYQKYGRALHKEVRIFDWKLSIIMIIAKRIDCV